MQQSQAKAAQTRWELENQIDEEKIYRFDEDAIQATLAAKPWKTLREDPKNQDHFKHTKISAVALIKMVMHSKSGLGVRSADDVEVMGALQGYPAGDTMYVMDAVPMPCEGVEARVNAGAEALEY